MRKLVVTVALATAALSTPALASTDARYVHVESGTNVASLVIGTTNFMPSVENKGDGRGRSSDSLVDALDQGDLDLSDFLPEVPEPEQPNNAG